MSTIIAKFSEKMEPGAVLSSSWGYDQTNYDFYVVVKMSATSIWLQKIKQDSSDYNGQYMTSVENPVLGEYLVGAPMRRKYNGGNWVNINSYAGARLWDGKPKNATHYA